MAISEASRPQGRVEESADVEVPIFVKAFGLEDFEMPVKKGCNSFYIKLMLVHGIP